LVRTCFQCVVVILRFRDRINGLLLSELGGYLLSPEQAPAGKKRLENLLNAPKWTGQLIKDWLLAQADARLAAWQEQGRDGLASLRSQPLGKTGKSEQRGADVAVQSSKGKRLTPIKPGYLSPPGGLIMVPGLHWLTVLLVGRSQSQDPLQLAHVEWWSTRGVQATPLRDQEVRVLLALVGRSCRGVLHVAGSRLCRSVVTGSLTWAGGALCAALPPRLSARRCHR
jgi:hypothetical protein